MNPKEGFTNMDKVWSQRNLIWTETNIVYLEDLLRTLRSKLRQKTEMQNTHKKIFLTENENQNVTLLIWIISYVWLILFTLPKLS